MQVNSNSYDDRAIGPFGNDRKRKFGEMSTRGRKKKSANSNHQAQWSQSTNHSSTWLGDFTGSEEFVGKFAWGVNPEYWAVGDGKPTLGAEIVRRAGSKGEGEGKGEGER